MALSTKKTKILIYYRNKVTVKWVGCWENCVLYTDRAKKEEKQNP